MPKADTEHTTAGDTTTLPPPAIPPMDRIHRGLWGHLWGERSPQNKLQCICGDASRRLAARMRDPEAKWTMLEVAANYEKLAVLAAAETNGGGLDR